MPMPNNTTIRIVFSDWSTCRPVALPTMAITGDATIDTSATMITGSRAAIGLR